MTAPLLGDILEGADTIAAYMSSLGGRRAGERVYYLVQSGAGSRSETRRASA